MAEQHQILLIPQDRYWEWVQAARDFVVHFGLTMTPDRESAGRFRGEGHVVSVIDFPAAWPDEIRGWFQVNYPAITLDVIEVASPEALEMLLEQRIADEDPFGKQQLDFRLRWPTDYVVITQPYGVNFAYYRRFGLPGHEGVDIRALMDTPVYACADGEVYLVHDGRQNHPYGKHVRIRHLGGYKTVYAHLSRPLVAEHDQVEAGQRIGLADSTGNSSASHLHLTLKKEGATGRGETPFPSDIIDPTLYLQRPDEVSVQPEWEAGVCLAGVHGRADGSLQEADYDAIRSSRVEAVKLSVNADPIAVDRCRAINPDCFFLARLFADLRGRVARPDEFAGWQVPDMQRLYARGVRYFEVHNEPNLNLEGLGNSWRDGDEFEAWFLRVVEILRPQFPEAKFGFPGCSPGGDVVGKRQDMWRFVGQCERALVAADWIGVHCYWQDEDEMLSSEHGLNFRGYRHRWPAKLILVTEFSNPASDVDSRTKGEQYVRYYRHLRYLPGIGAAFCFVLSASSGYAHEAWRRENGQLSMIPSVVGGRDF